MLKKSLVLLLALAIFFVIGCDKDDSTGPSDDVNEFELLTQVGDAYFSTYTTPGGKAVNTSISAIFPILADGDDSNDPFIVDFRSSADFATGHLKGAVNISLGSLVEKLEDGTIPADRNILNVCYTGQTASWATAIMNMLGYEAQNLLFGMCGVTTDSEIAGTGKWNSNISSAFAGQMVADETEITESFDFPKLTTGEKDAVSILKKRAQTIGSAWGSISNADVLANPENYFIVNYWPLAEYKNPGHIPGAVCFEPTNAFKADQKLKNLPTDKTIVVYCYTGQTSAQVTAYLQCLGYDAKSLLYGFNGMAYDKLSKSKYVAPTDDYSSIIIK